MKTQTAKERYDELMTGEEEKDPLERLRFFCSLAMSGKDWLDVECFLDDIEKLQRQNAMLLHAIYPMEESARQIFETHGYSEMANWAARLQAARCATSAQSAAWLEAYCIEWMRGLKPTAYWKTFLDQY